MVSVIFGASSGIGKQVYRVLRSRGESAVAVARSADKLESLVSSVGGSYVSADATNSSDVSRVIKHVNELYSSDEVVRVLYAPGVHEPASIVVDGIKRYSRLSDFTSSDRASPFWNGFPEFSQRVNVYAPINVHKAFSSVFSDRLFFVYVSSQAASDFGPDGVTRWEDLGNSLYAPQKRTAEGYMQSNGAYSLRFGLAGKTMAKKLIDELEGLESWVHVDNDIKKPVRDALEIALPLDVLCSDISDVLLGRHSHFVSSQKSSYVLEYPYTPSEVRSF